MSSLIKAHGGTLVERILTPTEALALQERASQLETVTLDGDELLDLELLASGGASPLSGFMGQRDHRSVLDRQRLAGGALFPVPIVLSVSVGRLGALAPGTLVALRDAGGALRGAMTVSDTFVRDVREEARLVHGTDDPAHPGAARLLARPAGALGGEVALIRPRDLRFETAREVRLRLAQHGFFRVAAGLGTKAPRNRSAVPSGGGGRSTG
jgi:sulfate adenylyltransferase